MSYDRLSGREKDVVNLLMDAGLSEIRNRQVMMAKELGISTSTVKQALRTVGFKYGVDARIHNVSVRVVYLRALELGLLQPIV